MTDLRGLDDAARAAVGAAEREAAELGRDAIGTEHLLLGVLVGDGRAARALVDAGATLAAARHKVAETGRGRGAPADRPLPMTSRAERAIGRAVRFSHNAKAEAVGTEHLMLGVLDVEGTAGQVLRGIGVDVAALRSALVAPTASAAPEPVPASAPDVVAPRCSGCGADVTDLAFTIVTATSDEGRAGEAVVFSCRTCGVVLGVAPRARRDDGADPPTR